MPSNSENLETLRKLRVKQENRVCIDCPNRNPDWCSVPFGVWICIDCAGQHRKMGTHLSFVRSSLYDTWNDEQIAYMKLGGNAKAKSAFLKGGIQSLTHLPKYSSGPAKSYKLKLQGMVQDTLNGSSKHENKDFSDNDEKEISNISNKMNKLSVQEEEEVTLEIRSMTKKSQPSTSTRAKPISKPTAISTRTVPSKFVKPKKVDSNKWDNWDEEDSDEDASSEESDSNDDGGWSNQWDSPKARAAGSPSSKKIESSENSAQSLNGGSSLVSKYGYQARTIEKNHVANQGRMEGYGSSNHFGSFSEKPRVQKDYTIESLQEIQDLDDLKLYAKQRGVQIATVGKEYSEYLKERGTEIASDLTSSIKNWWRDFQNQ